MPTAKPTPAPPTPKPMPPAAPDLSKLPFVQSIEIQFHTNDDDLDDDSLLSVTFLHGSQIVAEALPQRGSVPDSKNTGLFGLREINDFSDNQSTPWLPVQVMPGVFLRMDMLHQCSTKVRIDPQGNDTWRFNYWVRVRYNNQTTDEFHFDGHALSEKVRENSFPLNKPFHAA